MVSSVAWFHLLHGFLNYMVPILHGFLCYLVSYVTCCSLETNSIFLFARCWLGSCVASWQSSCGQVDSVYCSSALSSSQDFLGCHRRLRQLVSCGNFLSVSLVEREGGRESERVAERENERENIFIYIQKGRRGRKCQSI